MLYLSLLIAIHVCRDAKHLGWEVCDVCTLFVCAIFLLHSAALHENITLQLRSLSLEDDIVTFVPRSFVPRSENEVGLCQIFSNCEHRELDQYTRYWVVDFSAEHLV